MAKNFRKAKMASEDVGSLLLSGAYYVGTTRTEVPDGSFVVVGGLEAHSLYTGEKDLNTYKVTAPTATTDSVAVVDFSGVTEGAIQGVTYREGIKGYGIACPANRTTRVRTLFKGDTFWLGSGNFAATPTVGNICTPTANALTLTDSGADSLVASTTCILVETSRPVTEGVLNTDTEYFCRVLQVV